VRRRTGATQLFVRFVKIVSIDGNCQVMEESSIEFKFFLMKRNMQFALASKLRLQFKPV
jgi:hypothetical protein